MKPTMNRFSSFIICTVLLISCHGISSSNDPVDDTQAPISRLGESSIGPKYRERRSEQSSMNEVDGNLGQSDNYNGDNELEDEEYSDDDEDEGDGQYETEEISPSLPQNSNLHESLNLLKNTRKSLGRYVREDGALDKLMVESSELAKEVGQVFHQLAKREVGLQKQMESLKEALNGAVVTLKNTFKKEEKTKNPSEENETDDDGESGGKVDDEETTKPLPRQPRHLNLHKNPYRACVQIEPITDEEDDVRDSRASAASHYKSLYQQQQQQQQGPLPPPPLPPAAVQEYMPSPQELKKFQAQRLGQSSSFSAQQTRVSVQSDNRNNEARETSKYPQPGNNAVPPLPPTSSRQLPPPPPSRPLPPPPSRQLPPPPPRQLPPLPMTAQSQASQSQASQSQASQSQMSQSKFQSSNVANANVNRNAAMSSSSVTSNTKSNANPAAPHNMDDVDLSEVYWLRLNPERRQEMLHKKLDTLLKEKQSQGRDVLVIPLNHGLHDTEEVKNGFLRAVRVRPSALKNKLFRQLRSLQVREL